ncbi:hypothetical protein NPIL_644091 [Nephila pilipes]|uniref:Uncharacterized protein n=1 Tax=Nephila pilipes TaxID=299642 RepID=A0A8X6Q016_NEPPI|nr:hypothetical protein NPIL_644091 [Nephila pilipes]
MEMNNNLHNEMDYNDDSRSTISSISANSVDTSSPCERKQKIELQIRNKTRIRADCKSELAHNFSIHKDIEHPDYKSSLNAIK